MMKVISCRSLPNRFKTAPPCSSKSFNATVRKALAKATSKPCLNRSRWNKTNAVTYKKEYVVARRALARRSNLQLNRRLLHRLGLDTSRELHAGLLDQRLLAMT